MGDARFEPVRIGVVGFGNFGRLHVHTVAKLFEAELAAVVDERRDRLEEAASHFPGVPTFPDIERGLAESRSEAWIVASSTGSHVAIAERILDTGLPVLVEKPLSTSLREAERLRDFVTPDSSNFMMGHIVLFNSEFRQLVTEARGRPALEFVSCARHRPSTTPDLFPGENPYYLLMVHDLYSVLTLVNRREPSEISAQARCREDGVCDLALAQLVWNDGLLASFTASFLAPPGMAADGYDRMEVYGRGWASRIEPNPRPIIVWDHRAHAPLTLEIAADTTGPSGMLAEELRRFCRVVRGAAAVPIGATFEDAIAVLRWLDEIERCAGMLHNDLRR